MLSRLFALLVRYISNMAVSLLPSRYRKWWKQNATEDLRKGGVACGLLQAAVCLSLLVVGFVEFGQAAGAGNVPSRIANTSGQLIDRLGPGPGEIHGEGELIMGMGQYLLFDFFFQPQNLAFFYFWLEGLIRCLGAVVSGQVLGTFPLYLISGTHSGIQWIVYRHSLGPLVDDEVRPGDGTTYDMKVLTCRPKTDWSPYITVRFRGEFYQMIKEERAPKPRTFVYLLRKNPTGRLVVRIKEYRPYVGK